MFWSLAGFMLSAIIVYGSIVERNWIKIQRYTIRHPKVRQPFSAVHLSDFHYHQTGFREHRLAHFMTRIQPDFLFLTGDYTYHPERLETFLAYCSSFVIPGRTFGVWGNLERWIEADLSSFESIFGSYGIEILCNRSRLLRYRDSSISVSGLDDPYFGYDEPDRLACPDPEDGTLHFLLAHTPDVYPRVKSRGFDIFLFGHTHGGQVKIPFFSPFYTDSRHKALARGLIQTGTQSIHTNPGIGNAKIGFRFGVRPEISVLEFQPSDQNRNRTPARTVTPPTSSSS